MGIVMIDGIYIWSGYIISICLATLMGYFLGLYTQLTEVKK